MTDDLRRDLEPHDADELVAFAERLRHERPVPAAQFRGDLRRRLVAHRTSRPRQFWAAVTASASSGTALLAVAAVGVAGGGPFAA